MATVIYGFVDDSNVLREFAFLEEGDIETLERIKKEYNLPNAYLMNWDKELAILGETYWNGIRFVPPSPLPSWIWNEEKNNWQPPVPMPTDTPEGKTWIWNEDEIDWVLATIQNP